MEFIIGAIVIFVLYKLGSGKPKPKAKASSNTSPSVSITSNSINSKNTRSSASSKVESTRDDDFATFRVYTSYGAEAEKTSNTQKGRWVSEGEQLTVNGRQIPRGFYYFGGVLNALTGYGIEPSLVDEKRPALTKSFKTGSDLYTDESLGYWPSYATLSKACRGAYLDFLASDRTDSGTPIGYVFIYFYGFERRIIENRSNNSVSDEEFLTIFNEVLRLNRVFNANRSFRGYSASFLELMTLLRPALLEHRAADIPETNNGLSFKVRLATTIAKGQPVNADLALDWLKNTFEYTLKTPARRCEAEFRKLFQIRFKEKFGDGILVKPNKTKLTLSYHAASNGIHRVDLNLEDLPDPSVLKAPLNKLIPIAEQCTDELNSYSRYLGKADTSKDEIAALMLLPKELANEADSPVIGSFKQWAEQIITNHKGLTTVQDFWSHTGMPMPKALNKKEIDLLTNLAAKAEIGIAPDQRFHLTKFKADGNIVLFSPGHGEFFESSPAFHQVMLALRLGAMVATIDGVVAADEEKALRRIIEHDDKLSPTDKNSLSAYLTWRLNSPANTAGLSARIEQLNETQIEFLKRFIVSIALADGKVDADEIKQIEKLYAFLGLDKSLVTSDIHHLTTTTKGSLSTQQDTGKTKDVFLLDEEILAMHENDTSDAKSMLESIFAVDDEPESEPIAVVNSVNSGLDTTHQALFEQLITKAAWTRHEVHELCSKLKLMIDGAIETINEWAYEKVEAPVLDDDGDIYVDLEIVEELRGK
ncbi:TerB N-terminal domain-containing protein [Shewanella zhangzhouensis]|uniref:tellurite resistance TerB family protein n=1 Tax=Shewanella zhangzhouensis TaxID=2864213 RepID=UPI001C65A155|nr:TerB N-terminal domain-containing protein [Shewanella zhangzhouensis]QYK03563.1 TerB N-terminal domain-containing protein [Shewanella zhangzhouensis]